MNTEQAIHVLEGRLVCEFRRRFRRGSVTSHFGRECVVMDRRQIRATVCALRSLRKEAGTE